jgi:hypothetical protein
MHRDPLLEALIGKLPEAGQPWPQADRDVWFTLMRSAFDLVYGRDGQPAPKPTVTDLPRLPLVGDTVEEPVVQTWHIDAGGFARAPTGEEAPLEGTPRGTVFLDLRPQSDGRVDTVTWADGTWPTSHVHARSIKLEAKAA